MTAFLVLLGVIIFLSAIGRLIQEYEKWKKEHPDESPAAFVVATAVAAGLLAGLVFALYRGMFGSSTEISPRDTVKEAEHVERQVESRTQPKSEWIRASGNLWTGVKLYYGSGPEKRYVGEVLGGNDKYVDPYTGRKFRGLKIRMSGGSTEWKNRKAVIAWGYVKRDDPALDRMEWYVYEY